MTINYKEPLRDMDFVYYELFNGEELTKLPGYGEAVPETVKAILQEAAKMAENVLLPLNQSAMRKDVILKTVRLLFQKDLKKPTIFIPKLVGMV